MRGRGGGGARCVVVCSCVGGALRGGRLGWRGMVSLRCCGVLKQQAAMHWMTTLLCSSSLQLLLSYPHIFLWLWFVVVFCAGARLGCTAGETVVQCCKNIVVWSFPLWIEVTERV